MSVAIVTGSSGLIGSEMVRYLHGKGLHVAGIDNNMRRYFFGEDGDVGWNTRRLEKALPSFEHHPLDIRDAPAIDRLFRRFGSDIELVVHAAAQPSHDWASREPVTDFTVNANGTLALLEAARHHCATAVFIHISTNKVYGDTPNRLPLVERETRWEVDPSHPYAEHGIDESMSIDQSKHSLFGASKLAADILVQEYGRYFGLRTATLRGGCLTGPAHAGAELHGFLAYLVKCAVEGRPYTVFGYRGKQVRDTLHSRDLVTACWEFFRRPTNAAVYNLGGSRHSNCSVLEAIAMIEQRVGEPLQYTVSEEARSGDHIWWIIDVRSFQRDYPEWKYEYGLEMILDEIIDSIRDRSKRPA